MKTDNFPIINKYTSICNVKTKTFKNKLSKSTEIAFTEEIHNNVSIKMILVNFDSMDVNEAVKIINQLFDL